MKSKININEFKPHNPTPAMIPMIGKKYGNLLVTQLGLYHTKSKKRRHYFYCVCDCGNIFFAEVSKIKSGHTTSCGCVHKERQLHAVTRHGDSNWSGKKERNVVYSKWVSVKARCLYPSSPGYYRYGGKGITICNGYRYNYPKFKEDLGIQPTTEHSLDRINPALNYSCGGCEQCIENNWPMNIRWADKDTQANNKQNCVYLDVDGAKMSAAQLARKLNVNDTTIRERVRSGWSTEKILSTPIRKRNK